MSEGKIFNVRVYGIFLNDKEELLLAEEYHYDTFMRKFPGGGLQFGEGTRDGLIREIKEELHVDIETCVHFHTTDFFVRSAFNENHQVIAIYYLVKTPKALNEIGTANFELPKINGEEIFRWVSLKSISPDDFTFPVDQKVVELILEKWKNNLLIFL